MHVKSFCLQVSYSICFRMGHFVIAPPKLDSIYFVCIILSFNISSVYVSILTISIDESFEVNGLKNKI